MRPALQKTPVQRNSAIELVKVIAIILIIISHCVPVYGNGDYVMETFHATRDVQTLIVIWIRHFGQIANVVFIIASAWFLTESHAAKMEKVFSLILDTMMISLLFLIPFLFTDYRIDKTVVIENVFSLLHEKNWFVTCYILLYLIHPALNAACEATKDKTISKLLFSCLFIYLILVLIQDFTLYCNRFVSFICLYLFTWYFKTYQKDLCDSTKFNAILLTVSAVGIPVILFFMNFLGLKTGLFDQNLQRFNILTNPLYIGIAIGSVNLARKSQFRSRTINYLSSLSLLVYLITENYMLKYFVKPTLFEYLYDTFTYNRILLWCLGLFVITTIVGFLVSAFYHETFKKLTTFLSKKLCPPLNRLYHRLETALFHE